MDNATRQGHLFDGVHDGPNDGYLPTNNAERMPGIVRPRLAALLAEARAADRIPWSVQDERVNALLFHNMANWLPPAERDELRAAFLVELSRLREAGERNILPLGT